MEIRDWFILISTFLVGIMSGVYLYATSFAPTYEERDVFDEAAEVPHTPFDVIALQYGGMVPEDYENAFFEVDDSGSYAFTPGGVGVMEQESVLPEVLKRELHDEIATADLKKLSEPIERSDCASFSDGIDYEYNIVRKGEEYTLDTCYTDFSHDSELGRTLEKMWQYMNAPEEHRISISNTTDDAVTVGEVDLKEEAKEKKRIILNPIKYLEQGFEDSFGDDAVVE